MLISTVDNEERKRRMGESLENEVILCSNHAYSIFSGYFAPVPFHMIDICMFFTSMIKPPSPRQRSWHMLIKLLAQQICLYLTELMEFSFNVPCSDFEGATCDIISLSDVVVLRCKYTATNQLPARPEWPPSVASTEPEGPEGGSRCYTRL